MASLKTRSDIAKQVKRIVNKTPIVDIHTHIYPPRFGGLLLWGIDELVTYHYLVAETFRHAPMPYDKFWALSKKQQSDRIWKTLFLDHSPVSESCRGVLTTLKQLKIGLAGRDIKKIRKAFTKRTAAGYVDEVFKTANLSYVVMTNNPLDPLEYPVWQKKGKNDPRFKTSLRLDNILNDWPEPVGQLKKWGYKVSTKLDKKTTDEIKRFLGDWIDRIGALYLAVSLPPTFMFPEKSKRATLIEKCVLPIARTKGIPFALMIGVKKLVNPDLLLAGDSVGPADVSAVENLCRQFPDNRFLVTFLARENQHGFCVAARKFHNLMPFGCWWFMNNPSIIDEITRQRLELLGLSFIPQHSDARVLDQLIYKWSHSRQIIARVLTDKYCDLAATGWKLTRKDVRRDVGNLFGGNFERFCKNTPRCG